MARFRTRAPRGAAAMAAAAVGLVALAGPARPAVTASISFTNDWVADASGNPVLGGGGTGTYASLAVNPANTYTFTNTYLGSQSVFAVNPNYGFTVTGLATGDAVVVSLDLSSLIQISNIQARIISFGPPTTTSGPVPVPLALSGLQSGATLVSGPWFTPSTTPGTPTVIDLSAPALSPSDSYVLEIRGVVPQGATSGTYIGQLNLTAVPLPAALPLFLSGIGGLGTLSMRRRRTSPAARRV